MIVWSSGQHMKPLHGGEMWRFKAANTRRIRSLLGGSKYHFSLCGPKKLMMAWIQRPDFNCHKPGQNFNLPRNQHEASRINKCSHTHTHTQTHTHQRVIFSLSLSLSLSLSHTHTHTHTLSLSLALTHTRESSSLFLSLRSAAHCFLSLACVSLPEWASVSCQ